MNVIQHTRLRYREGNSDKVYEVDLVELNKTDVARYLVNFRYGRFGKSLREGSKTTSPVTLDKARTLFNSIVVSKVNKGYRIESGFDPLAATTQDESNVVPFPALHHVDTLRQRQNATHRHFLECVKRGDDKDYQRCNRIIWRLGELKAIQAVPDLIDAMTWNSDDDKQVIRNHSIAWALGRCGDARAIPILTQLIQTDTASHIQRIACQTLYQVTPHAERDTLLGQYREQLPASLTAVLSGTDDTTVIAENLLAWGQSNKPKYSQSTDINLTRLYLLANQDAQLREVLLQLIRITPFEFGSVWLIRLFFKVSEFALDGEFLAVLIKRIEDSTALPYNWRNNNYKNTYSNSTRDYLRRRSWRLLRRLGDLDDNHYVRLAKTLLLQYQDNEGKTRTYTHTRYLWENGNYRSINTTYHLHAFASHTAYNQILYRNSQQYRPKKSGKCWHKLADQTDSQRSEAFPQLWDQEPDAFIDCLKASECEAVHEFALRALSEKHDFCRQVCLEDWASIFCSPYSKTATLARDHIKQDHPAALTQLAFLHPLFAARTALAREFIHSHLRQLPADVLLADISWHCDLIVSIYKDNRQHADHYHSLYQPHNEKQQILLGKLIAYIQRLNTDTLPESDVWEHISWTLLNPLQQPLQTVSFAVLRDLVQHPAVCVQKLGADILVAQQHAPADIPDDIFMGLLESEDAGIRAIAVRLLANMDDQDLAAMPQLLASLLLSADAPVRAQTRPIIQRIAANDTPFSQALLDDLLPHSFKAQSSEGLHDILVACITEDLQQAWPHVDKNLLWRLLMAKSKAAQRIGSALLMARPHRDYSVRQWAHLGKHASLQVRQWVQQAYTQNISLIHEQFPAALRLLDTGWDDSRQFALTVFRERFSAHEWTTENLILLCDSVRDDVQRLGRELLRTFFKEDAGEDYLLKLSQHPSQNVQLFASEFLQTYAGGNAGILTQLQSYFITVLSSVNRGRIAKERVLRFLLQEAKQHRPAAEQVCVILTRQSVTVAVQDKAKFIRAMLELQQQYPDLKLPLKQTAPPVRGYPAELV